MNWKEISGDFYDGDLTGIPETPSVHKYDKTLTMKILLSRPDLKNDGETIVLCDFGTLKKFIIQLDRITAGMPKILYLVGWQYEGHDTGYPAFFTVNPELGENRNRADEELSDIMEEAKTYNTTVSLHINMTDAYPDSPLWEEYVRKDLISRRSSGKHLVTGRWYGRKAYQVCYSREWESGEAVRRIEKLMERFPLDKAGTVHIDAFFCRPSAFHRISIEKEKEARRKIIRYWRLRGVDVTSEFLYREKRKVDLIGLVPMVWHLNQSKNDYLRRPASLLAGGRINPDLRGDKKLNRIFGCSTHGEPHFSNKENTAFNEQWQEPFLKDFFINALPWQYLNSLKRLHAGPGGRYGTYSDGVTTYKRGSAVVQNGKDLCRNGNICIPALWSEEPLIGVYSRDGVTGMIRELPVKWKKYKEIQYEALCGASGARKIPLKEGKLIITLRKGEGGWIRPVEDEE